jgi:hypothetical protein
LQKQQIKNMRIGKYCLDITEFELKPWLRVELEYVGEEEEKGHVYVHRGWLWFVLSHVVSFGWKEFQETVNDIVDDKENT